jgi:hypothetical protein
MACVQWAGFSAVFLVSMLALPEVRAQTAPASAIDLLAAATGSAPWNMRYVSVTDVRYRAIVQTGTDRSCVGTDSVAKKYRDGARLHIIVDTIDYLTPAGNVIPKASRHEIVSDPSRRIKWWFPPDNPLNGTAQLAKSTKRIQEMNLIDESDPATGCFLDGYIDGLGNIVDLMKSDIAAGAASVTVHQEEWDGISCQVVESQTSTRRLAAWIAPSMENVIVKYLLDGNDPATGPTTALFESSTYQTVDGVTAIRAGHSSRTWTVAGDRSRWQETVDAERTNLDLHPDFNDPNLFTTQGIPNGVRVYLDELPNVGVDFVWNNGAPIAQVDADLFSELGTSVQRTDAGEVAKSSPGVNGPANGPVDDAEFAGGSPRTSELWIVLFGSAAMSALVLAGLYLKRGSLRELQ